MTMILDQILLWIALAILLLVLMALGAAVFYGLKLARQVFFSKESCQCDYCWNRRRVEYARANGPETFFTFARKMSICSKCGSKRCDRAYDHRQQCNEPN